MISCDAPSPQSPFLPLLLLLLMIYCTTSSVLAHAEKARNLIDQARGICIRNKTQPIQFMLTIDEADDFYRTVDAFKTDEQTACHGVWNWEKSNCRRLARAFSQSVFAPMPRWYRLTARLCSSSVALK